MGKFPLGSARVQGSVKNAYYPHIFQFGHGSIVCGLEAGTEHPQTTATN